MTFVIRFNSGLFNEGAFAVPLNEATRYETLKEAEDDVAWLDDVNCVLDLSKLPEDFQVHESHCCVDHGCKYGDDDCPVVSGQIKQLYDCEDCVNEGARIGFTRDLVNAVRELVNLQEKYPAEFEQIPAVFKTRILALAQPLFNYTKSQ